MRVVFLSPSSQLGGAEGSLLDLLASIRAAKPEWSLHVITNGEGPLVQKVKGLGISITTLSFPSALGRLGDHGARMGRRRSLLSGLVLALPGVLAYVLQLRKLLRQLLPDVVHSNGLKMHLLGVWARPVHVPIIWHVREYVSDRPAMSRLLRWNAARCAAAVAISRTVADDFHSVCRGRVAVYLVYNAVDTKTFAPRGAAADLDALANLPPAEPGTVRVGLPATLATWKGHTVFLRALASLPPTLPVRGYIIGGEIYEPVGSQSSLRELQVLANELGLSDRVGFTGFIENPARALRALDIVVHASIKPEPFGRVIVEAMACARPIVVSEAGGAAEIIDPETDALAYPPGDTEMLAVCIQRLVAAPELREQLGAAGRTTAERRFNATRLAAELLPLYELVTGKREPKQLPSRVQQVTR